MYEDHAPRVEHEITCTECGAKSTVPFEPKPGRAVLCRDCFSKNRPSGGGRNDRGPRRDDRGPREEHEVTCAECGVQTTVPFKPTSDRPVLCRDCFRKGRPAGGRDGPRGDRGNREMHAAKCSECGKSCEVPFKPTQGKPVRCNDCFRR